jgi:hypothetical protein
MVAHRRLIEALDDADDLAPGALEGGGVPDVADRLQADCNGGRKYLRIELLVVHGLRTPRYCPYRSPYGSMEGFW